MSILFQGHIGLLLVSCPAIEKLCPNELQKIVSKLGRLKLAKREKWKAKGKLDSPTHRLMDSAPYKHQVSLFCSDMSFFACSSTPVIASSVYTFSVASVYYNILALTTVLIIYLIVWVIHQVLFMSLFHS
mgnify:CR=1 FL=1